MGEINCLFDANTIVKYYHPEKGSETVQYIFDRSPAAVINLANLQLAEIISVFYKLRSQGQIKSDGDLIAIIDTFLTDIKSNKIKLYDLRNEHLKDLEVIERVWKIPLPKSIYRQRGRKPRCAAIDAIMLMIMREVHYITEKACFLVTSDEHALLVAKSFGIQTIDPEKCSVKNIPEVLDSRGTRRREKPLRVICKDISGTYSLGSSSIVDICESGMALRSTSSLERGRDYVFRIEPFNGAWSVDVKGKLVWSNNHKAGVRFSETISSDSLVLR